MIGKRRKEGALPQWRFGGGSWAFLPPNLQVIRLWKLGNGRERSMEVEEKVGGRRRPEGIRVKRWKDGESELL